MFWTLKRGRQWPIVCLGTVICMGYVSYYVVVISITSTQHFASQYNLHNHQNEPIDPIVC